MNLWLFGSRSLRSFIEFPNRLVELIIDERREREEESSDAANPRNPIPHRDPPKGKKSQQRENPN